MRYHKIENQPVQSATVDSIVVEKGQVRVPIDWNILINEFHFPKFSTNILYAGQLSKIYDVTLTCDYAKNVNRNVRVILRRRSDKAVAVAQMNKGLYTINTGKKLRSFRESQTSGGEDN